LLWYQILLGHRLTGDRILQRWGLAFFFNSLFRQAPDLRPDEYRDLVGGEVNTMNSGMYNNTDHESQCQARRTYQPYGLFVIE
jgi:hypothetical protein